MLDTHSRLLVLALLVATCAMGGFTLALLVDHEPARSTLVGGEAGTTVGDEHANTVAVCAGNETVCSGNNSTLIGFQAVPSDGVSGTDRVGETVPHGFDPSAPQAMEARSAMNLHRAAGGRGGIT